jgi:hypothetical protein
MALDRSMIARAPVGGGNRTCVVKNTGNAPASLPTVDMSADTLKGYPAGMMVFDVTEGTTFTGDVSLSDFGIELASKVSDTNWLEFKADTVRDFVVSKVDFTAEDSQRITKPTLPTNAVQVIGLTLGGELSGKRRVTAWNGFTDPASMGQKYAAGSFGDTNVKFVGYPAAAAITISIALISQAFGDVLKAASLTTMTIPINKIGIEADQVIV